MTRERCSCGYKRRGPGHDEGVHHQHKAIKVHTYGPGGRAEGMEMQRGPSPKVPTLARKDHPGADFRQVKTGGKR